MKGISTLGSAAEMTAHNAFVRINTNLQMVGEQMLTDAPLYTADVPEVLYEDLWISPDMIVFTDLEQPSESHVLVFKMTPAPSPGVSSGWDQVDRGRAEDHPGEGSVLSDCSWDQRRTIKNHRILRWLDFGARNRLHR